MSSDLLQQAMIDAAALKEAAMKNAENALIEKYSAEFNQTVQKLLEQEDAAAGGDAGMPPPGGETGGVTPDAGASPDVAGGETPDLSAGGADPMAGGDIGGGAEQNKAFSKVPGSFSGDDEEMITINFDQIKATLNEMYDAGLKQDPTPDALGAGEANAEVDDDEEQKELEEEILEMAESDEQNGGELEEDIEEIELIDAEDERFKDPAYMGHKPVVLKISPARPMTAPMPALSNDFYEDERFKDLAYMGHHLEELELELEEQTDGSTDVTSAGADDLKRSADLEKQAADAKQRANTAKAKAAQEKEKAEAALAAKKSAEASSSTSETIAETIEISEQELEELAEEMCVDIKVGNLSDGYMGSTETQKREQRTLELAAARSDKATEEREEEKKKMGDLVKENAKLKKLNNEALEAVTALKEQVEKMNLMNAKLLYTNKALGNISLNERQKTNIVESISKADSVLAAKTIYETVQNAVENIPQEREAPQSLRETLNRAATPFVVKKNANNSVTDLMAERLKTLAGIKKLS